jgi:hypothetical protein
MTLGWQRDLLEPTVWWVSPPTGVIMRYSYIVFPFKMEW